MGDIEHAGGRPDSTMLLHDAGVLDRHVPTAKLDHAGAAGHVSRFERGMLKKGRIAHPN